MYFIDKVHFLVVCAGNFYIVDLLNKKTYKYILQKCFIGFDAAKCRVLTDVGYYSFDMLDLLYGKPIFTGFDQNNYLKDLYQKSGIIQRNLTFIPLDASAI